MWTGVGFDTSLGQPTGTRRRISLPSRVSFRTMPELMTSEGEQDKEMNKLAAAELSRRRGWKKILGEQNDGLGLGLGSANPNLRVRVTVRVRVS